jgi:hypothetical protein
VPAGVAISPMALELCNPRTQALKVLEKPVFVDSGLAFYARAPE